MFKYICLIFISMVLPSKGVTPQQLMSGGQLLYDVLIEKGYVKQNRSISSEDKLALLKQAREVAKQKKDGETTQYLTEEIFDHQINSNRERFKKGLIIAVIATASFAAGWCYRIRQCAGSQESCAELIFHKYSWLQ